MDKPSAILPGSVLSNEWDIVIGDHEYYVTGSANLDTLLEFAPNADSIPFWATLWHSAPALSQWMTERANLLQGKKVLELGCGLGLCGITASKLGADVSQTDYIPQALELAKANAERNNVLNIKQFCADWRQWNRNEQYDFIIGSDLLYEKTLHPALEQACRTSLMPNGLLALADPCRHQGFQFGDYLASKGWKVDLVCTSATLKNAVQEVMIIEAQH